MSPKKTMKMTDPTAPTAPVPPTTDAPSPDTAANSQSALEAAMLRAVAEAAKLRLEVADLRAENAALKASPRATDARAATIGACRRVANPTWQPGSCDTCDEEEQRQKAEGAVT
jgi:hypothetical protein